MVEDTLFARVGHALRGSDGWIRPLARDLGIDRRTVERWATGRRQPPRDIWLWLSGGTQPAAQRGNREARRRSGAVARQLDLKTRRAMSVVAEVVPVSEA